MRSFGRLYQQQYAVALFNSIRFDVEGGGGLQAQLLQRKVAYPQSDQSGLVHQWIAADQSC